MLTLSSYKRSINCRVVVWRILACCPKKFNKLINQTIKIRETNCSFKFSLFIRIILLAILIHVWLMICLELSTQEVWWWKQGDWLKYPDELWLSSACNCQFHLVSTSSESWEIMYVYCVDNHIHWGWGTNMKSIIAFDKH